LYAIIKIDGVKMLFESARGIFAFFLFAVILSTWYSFQKQKTIRRKPYATKID